MKENFRTVQFISIIIITLFLITGCSKEPVRAGPKEPEKYSGFMELKAGQWAESMMTTDRGRTKLRVELIENTPELAKYQVISGEGAAQEVAQIWFDREAKQPVRYVLKGDDEIHCMSPARAPTTYITSDDSSYPAGKEGIRHAKTEVEGKEIAVAIFTGDDSEVWVSSQVPFGIVKVEQQGKAKIQLLDFGTIGAKSLISREEAERCEQYAQGYEAVTDPVQEDAAGEGEDTEDEDQTDYEAYYEEEEASGDQSYEATAYEHSTSEDTDFNCEDCEGMPPMAMNACLAACR